MEFKEFVNKLKPLIGGGASIPSFTRTLFELMVDENNSELVTSYSDEAFKHYYYGRDSIHGIAQKIVPYLQPGGFGSYISEFDDPVAFKIMDAFSDDIEDMSPTNIGEKLEYMFEKIIVRASEKTRGAYMEDEALGNQEEVVFEAEPLDEPESRTVVHQTNIVQNGDNCSVITSTGTVNINL